MNIVIWWNIPCKAISGVLVELSRIKDVNLVILTGRLSNSRKKMGWEEISFPAAKHIFLEDLEWETKANDLLFQYKEYLHIFNGFYYPKRIYKLINNSIKHNIKFGIFSEAPSNPHFGLKKIASIIYHNYFLPFRTHRITKNSEFIFCLSGSDKKEIHKLKRLGWTNDKIIPFGYFSEDNSQITHRVTNDIPVIFCPGNLVPHKGVDLLIKALKIVNNQKLNFHCHITGKGKEKEELIELTEKLDLTDKITFHGVLDQTKFDKLQQQMDILVAPGRIEPWGIRINEAIQNGQLVIISDQIGAKELISASGSGKIFKSGNYIDLANNLVFYLENKKLIQKAQDSNLEYKKRISPQAVSSFVHDTLISIENNGSLPKPNWL